MSIPTVGNRSTSVRGLTTVDSTGDVTIKDPDDSITIVSTAARDFLNDPTVIGKFNGLVTYKQNIADSLSSAAASLSAQDLSSVDAATTDMRKYNGQAAEFLAEASHDNESINAFMNNANVNLTEAGRVMQEIRDLATKRGLNYDTEVAPLVLESSVGETLKGAELNLGQQKTVVDMETIKYANKLADKAQQYLDGYDVVKKNQNLSTINQLVGALANLVTNGIWGGSALFKGFKQIGGMVTGAKEIEKLTAGEGADLIAMFQSYASTAWKGSPISAPALKRLADATPAGVSVDLQAYSDARDQDVNGALANMKGRLETLLAKAKKTQEELEAESDSETDPGWYIPSV